MSYSHRLMVPSPLGDIVVQGTQTHIQYLKFSTVDKQPLETQLETQLEPVDDRADWNKECGKRCLGFNTGVSPVISNWPLTSVIRMQ